MQSVQLPVGTFRRATPTGGRGKYVLQRLARQTFSGTNRHILLMRLPDSFSVFVAFVIFVYCEIPVLSSTSAAATGGQRSTSLRGFLFQV